MAQLRTIALPAHLKPRLAAGHPWVYRDQLPKPVRLPDGTWVRVQCGNFSAVGLWDAHSPIAVRLFARRRVPDDGWLAERIAQAWALRAPLRAARPATTAYRWLFGEGDGLPGLTVDLYGPFAVIQTYAGSVEALVPAVVAGLRRVAGEALQGVVARRPEGVQTLWGRTPPPDLTVLENGLTLRANLFEGQKTGLFLDQRDNRAYLAGRCAGLAVLDCFSYTGAFALAAVRGGAQHVTSVDASAQSVAAARENFRLNGVDPDRHAFLAEDCFELLDRFGREGRRFDLVILDPPSFARAKKSRHAAVRAYVRLNGLALQCVTPGGLLASASCTSQVSPEQFRAALAEAGARAGQRLQIIHEAGQPLDHPVPAGFPEGRYLKFVVGRVSPAP